MIAAREDRVSRILLVAVISLFFCNLIRTAWLSDDSYIVYRVVHNFINGYGLRWNVDERVQVASCPLWLLSLIPLHLVSGEIYYTAIFFSIFISLMGFYLLVTTDKGNLWGGIAVGYLACFSVTFVHYSTSGLENCLSHLLLFLYLGAFLKANDLSGHKKLTTLFALLALNRLDLTVLAAPAFFWRLRASSGSQRKQLLFYLWPIVAWLLFATFYYGTPLPNTFYAKLGAGARSSDLISQGLLYVIDLISNDPIAAIVIFFGSLLPFVLKLPKYYPISIGIIFYVLYIILIGGDFMSTRFFSPPLALSLMLTVLIFSEAGIREKGLYLAVVPLALYAFSFSHESVEGTINGKGFVSDAGISDERGLYYARTGLQRASLFYPNPRGEWLPPGVKGQKVYLAGRMGVEGYNAGPTLHIIDKMSLTDPLLARLPSSTRGWRIAHLVRPIPPGYFQTWQNDENKIEDPGLHEYYEHLKELTQAPLFGWNRFKEIFLFNFGYYDSLLESYLNPKGLTIKIEQINGSRSGQYIVGGGIDLMLDGLAHASHVELLVSDRHVHDVVFYREGVKLHTIETGPPLKVQENRGKVDVEVPSEVTKAGFDRVAIKDAGPVQYETDQSPFLYGIRLF